MTSVSMKEWTAWEAESLRLSAFLVPSMTITDQGKWFITATGSVPESVTEKQGAGQYLAEGTLKTADGEYHCNLFVGPDRVDWILSPATSNTQPNTPNFSIGSVKNPWVVLREIATLWLTKQELKLSRIAFGGVLSLRVPDRQSGYQQLNAYLPSVVLDPSGSRDFYYRINRPRKSTTGIAGLEINRMSIWSVGQIHRVQMHIPGPGMMPQPVVPGTSPISICRLEFDVNTIPETPNELPNDRLVDIFIELMDLAKEIAQKGDIK